MNMACIRCIIQFAFSRMNNIRTLRYIKFSTRCLHASSSLYNYYQTLGVSSRATAKEIKAAYFGLAKKCHPDISKDTKSKTKFQEISKAYQVLNDEKLRAEYDLELSSDSDFVFKSDVFRDETPEGIFRSAFNINFEDLFSQRFGYTAEMENQQEYRIGLTLAEAVKGVDKYIEINTSLRCSACQGLGTMYGADKSRYQCPRCYGGGELPSSEIPLEWMGSMKPDINEWTQCNDCGGRGYIITEYCDKCKGIGRENYLRFHHITIPPNTKHGQVISCPGIEGETLYITVYILKTHGCIFNYCEDKVATDIEINYSTLINGGWVTVPTLTGGKTTLQVPPNTRPGDCLELNELTPPHMYKVELYLPNVKDITNQLNDIHIQCLELEKVAYVSSFNSKYSPTVEINFIPKKILFKNDLYNVTIKPFIGFILQPLINLSLKIPLVNKITKRLEEYKFHSFYEPDERGNYRRF